MIWSLTADAAQFAASAESWLLRDPVRNTVMLTVLRGLRSGQFAEDPLFGWATGDDGTVVGAFCHTPPYPLTLGEVPPGAIAPLVRDLVEADRRLTAVRGPVSAVEAFATAWWRPESGRRAERLYLLDTLRPAPAPGKPRIAGPGDVDQAARWFREFEAEAHIERAVDVTPLVSARINREELVWWEDEGRPVSLAGVSAPISGMSRIGPVYTPLALRGRGYGSAVTHAVTRKALDDGATEVLLFTDLSNLTSNSIYQRLGYRPIADHATIHFA
ncbi:GNAT family N-acetyltransferase [Microbispora sp. CA-135349]|uniref:GNAT family N-acetyltransferase n=1 Tax=Microbispora sp. CA-135349 TaxID=3239953 RepID=UPI003D91850E